MDQYIIIRLALVYGSKCANPVFDFISEFWSILFGAKTSVLYGSSIIHSFIITTTTSVIVVVCFFLFVFELMAV